MTAVEFDPLTRENRAILQDMERRRLVRKLDVVGLLALSDLYDDVGDLDMAAFCRYMPHDPRIPSESQGEWDWWWEDETDLPCNLPRSVYRELSCGGYSGTTRGAYLTRDAAERDLGRVLRLLGLTG